MAGNFQQDLRGGLRMLKKSPGFTFVAVLSLALGIGANAAIFTIINAVFLHPLPVAEPSRLAEMFTHDTLTFNANVNFQLTGTSLPNYEDYRDQNNAFSGLATVTFPIPLNWGGQAEPQQLNASLVSGNFFDVLGIKPYRGRTFIPDGDKKVGGNPEVVLSYSLWARRFGSDDKYIGQIITLNGTTYTVVGIAPPSFKGIVSLGRPDVLWIPITMRDYVLTGQIKDWENNRRFRWLSIVGRLKPQVGVAEARAAMKTVAAGLEKEYPRGDGRGAASVGPAASDGKHCAITDGRLGWADGRVLGSQRVVVLPAAVSSRWLDRSFLRCPRVGIYRGHLPADGAGLRHHPGH